MDLDPLVDRVRTEFIELPGLRLTFAQATRLWSLEPAVCREVLDVLVGSRFLRWTPTGTIARADR
jgi:hypothetical protein